MRDIKKQILDASKNLNIKVEEIGGSEKEEFFKGIQSKYLVTQLKFPLWERLKDAKSRCNENAWQWVQDYIKNTSVILFFNPSDEKGIFKLESGEDVVNILGEMFNIEFYLSNGAAQYLLCYNHHNILLALGDAKRWLEDYSE